MESCWNFDPGKRPDFVTLNQKISAIPIIEIEYPHNLNFSAKSGCTKSPTAAPSLCYVPRRKKRYQMSVITVYEK
jgi:hypothetical protein